MELTLYSYWRSSSSWRVRIALALKGLPYRYEAVALLPGDQFSEGHTARNPMAQIPVLEVDGVPYTQSLAICDLLEHLRPEPALLPADPMARAKALALAEIVNAGIQPIQNLAVLKEVVRLVGPEAKLPWGKHWIELGLRAYERELERSAGAYSVGDQVSLADVFLVPQLYNARRFGCDLAGLPRTLEIEGRCLALPAFMAAHPDRQPDAPNS